jgi:hypothetical protein
MALTHNGTPVTDIGPTPAFAEWFDHLKTECMEQPVRLRLVGHGEYPSYPSFAIRRLLKDGCRLSDPEMSHAAHLDRQRREIAFDAAAVENVEDVLSEIKDLVDRENYPPEDMKSWNKLEYLESTVFIDTIDTPEGV